MSHSRKSDIVNLHLAFVSKLECTLSVFFAKCVGLVDLGILRKFAISFHCVVEK
jgi:hypothetical protein